MNKKTVDGWTDENVLVYNFLSLKQALSITHIHTRTFFYQNILFYFLSTINTV